MAITPILRPLISTIVLLTISAAAALSEPEPPPAGNPASQQAVTPSFTEAQEWFMSGQYERARQAFEQLAVQPEHAVSAQLGAARCLMVVGRYEEALAALTALNAAREADWHYLMAQVCQRIGRYDAVLAHCEQARTLSAKHLQARLLEAQMLEYLDRREEAIAAYKWFEEQTLERGKLPRDAEWLTCVGLGFLRYSELTRSNVADRTRHVLREMLQPAYEAVDRTYWPARLAAAELLRARYNNSEHDGSVSDYMAALRLNENLPEAYVGLGEVLLEGWRFEGVEQQANRALAINPVFGPALHLLARSRVVERRYAEAIELCDRALAVNPADLAALSIRASAHACAYDEESVAAVAQRVAAVNPRCALLHHTLGQALSGIRQYADSERHLLRAIELHPDDANARTELGMMYMQWGDEAKARAALEASWAIDPYNERTKHTLELLDSLEKFDEHETDHFLIKYDAKQDPGIGRHVGAYMESIYQAVVSDYDAVLAEKTIIEIFPTHKAFGVRITGQPWIHTVGACTGRVIAIQSPRKSPELMGNYNVANVLRHEFTHTVTLARTQNRIPHWFTEGLAVLQEDTPRSFDWCVILAEAIRRDGLFSLEEISWAFIRPRRATDRSQAYAQSEWMCEFLIDQYGYDAINRMLDQFEQRKTQKEVFENLLGTTEADFDERFARWAAKQAAAWGLDLTPVQDPQPLRLLAAEGESSAALLAQLARAEFDEENWDAALQAARRALGLNADEPVALTVLVRVLRRYAEQTSSRSARAALERESQDALVRLVTVDPASCVGHRLLAELYMSREDFDAAEAPLKALQKHCPLDPTSWRGLAGLYLVRKQNEEALAQLLTLARMDEHDADVPAQIGRMYRRAGRLPDAIYWLRQSLYIDPFRPQVLKGLAEVSMMADDSRAALDAYALLAALEPREAGHFSGAAFAAHKLGDDKEAAEWARRAAALDPQSPAAALIAREEPAAP